MDLILLSSVILCVIFYFYMNETKNRNKLYEFSKLFSRFVDIDFDVFNVEESINYIKDVFKSNKLQDVDELIFMILSFHIKTSLNPQLISLCDDYCDLNGNYKNDIIRIVEKYGY